MKISRSVSAAVVEAVADREGVSPMELTEQLYDALDPDAMDRLFTSDAGQLRFQYHGYTVTVTGDDRVDISPLDER